MTPFTPGDPGKEGIRSLDRLYPLDLNLIHAQPDASGARPMKTFMMTTAFMWDMMLIFSCLSGPNYSRTVVVFLFLVLVFL